VPETQGRFDSSNIPIPDTHAAQPEEIKAASGRALGVLFVAVFI
jgi:hypothetical protein